ASRPSTQPCRIWPPKGKVVSPRRRYSLGEFKHCGPGIDQDPKVPDERADETHPDPPHDPDRDRRNILEGALIAEQPGANDQQQQRAADSLAAADDEVRDRALHPRLKAGVELAAVVSPEQSEDDEGHGDRGARADQEK